MRTRHIRMGLTLWVIDIIHACSVCLLYADRFLFARVHFPLFGGNCDDPNVVDVLLSKLNKMMDTYHSSNRSSLRNSLPSGLSIHFPGAGKQGLVLVHVRVAQLHAPFFSGFTLSRDSLCRGKQT